MEGAIEDLHFNSKLKRKNDTSEYQTISDDPDSSSTKRKRYVLSSLEAMGEYEKNLCTMLDNDMMVGKTNLFLYDHGIVMKKDHFYFDSNPRKLTKLSFASYFTSTMEEQPAEIIVKSQLASPAARLESQLLEQFQFSKYSPKSFNVSLEMDDTVYFAMEKLDEDFYDLKFKSRRLRAFSQLFYVAKQSLNALKDFHSMGYVHGDIKPSNFMIKNSEFCDGMVKLIDYGHASRFRSTTGELLSPRMLGRLTGTPRYASPNVHKGYEPRRSDDLVSFLITLCELGINENLPWIKFENCHPATTLNKKMGDEKQFKLPNLVSKGPLEPFKVPMTRFMEHIFGISRDMEPDYELLEECLDHAMTIALASDNDLMPYPKLE